VRVDAIGQMSVVTVVARREADANTSVRPGRNPDRPPGHLSRRLLAEFVGTFFLVAIAAGADIVADLHVGEVSDAARAVAPALVVAAMIYALGAVSGAHFNPAVTTAFAVRGVFPWPWVPAYIGAQLGGAVAAAGVLHLLFSPSGHQGTTYPHGGSGQSFAVEILLTTMLVVVILHAAKEHRLLGPDAALPTGATIAAAGLVGLAVSGASMNPARSLGPAIVAGIGADQWIYVAGPLTGALIAVAAMTLIRGTPDAQEVDAAQGDVDR
jgi:aquaporin Z